MGIKHVGSSAAKELARNYESLAFLAEATTEDLVEIDGIGAIMAESVVEFFASHENRLIIEGLSSAGVETSREPTEPGSSPLAGTVFVLTGSLESLTRNQAAERIESLGGKVSSSVSAKTSYLVAGPGAGSKLAKAESLGVEVLDEEAFLAFLANQ